MFEKLLSNSAMKAQLISQIKTGRVGGAYLFCGAEGSGKKTAAVLLASYLVGKNGDKAERGVHPDVITLSPADGKKLITVAQIRSMRADAFINPSEGTRKIYIIDGVQLMNEAGQNALLTILEQPPSHAVFILLSESRGCVLPTVISRCAVYDMEYVPPKDGAALLKKRLPQLSEKELEDAMLAAQGNVGEALRLLQTGGDMALCEKIALAAANGDEYAALAAVSGLPRGRAAEVMSSLAAYLRDILAYRGTKDANMTVFTDSILKNSKQFDKINLNILYDSIRACEQAEALINAFVSPALAAENAVACLCGGKKLD